MHRGQRREETFENVLRNPLTFPSKPAISPEAQDLISKLLVKDPAQRLGTQAGAEEIKTHPWFADLNFALLRHQTPPYVPRKAAQPAAAAAAAMPAAASSGIAPAKPSVDEDGGAGVNAFDNY